MRQYVLLAGGLGNQLFQYAAAVSRGASTVVFVNFIQNARRDYSGRPEIMSLKLPVPIEFIEISNHKYLLRKYFLWLLGSTSRPSSIRFRFVSSRIVLTVAAQLVKISKKLSLHIEIENRLHRRDTLEYDKHEFLFIGYFQTLEDAKSIEKNVEHISLLNCSEDFLVYLKTIESEEVIGLHIRLGDYVNHPTFGNLSKSYFKEVLASIWIPGKKVIIFSDSNVSAEEYVPVTMLPFTTICPDSFTGLETLLLMSRCSDLVMSNSSLSWWSAFIGQKIGNHAYAPEPWFRSEVQSPNFYHPNWRRRKSDFLIQE